MSRTGLNGAGLTGAGLTGTGLNGDGAASLFAVLASLMASPQGRSDWLLDYWTRDLLFGVTARRTWVEPDRAPLPI